MAREATFGGHPSRFEFDPATLAAALHAPINAKPCFTGVILPERWRAFRLRQHRKDLSLLLGNGLRLLWSSFLPAVPQPLICSLICLLDMVSWRALMLRS